MHITVKERVPNIRRYFLYELVFGQWFRLNGRLGMMIDPNISELNSRVMWVDALHNIFTTTFVAKNEYVEALSVVSIELVPVYCD